MKQMFTLAVLVVLSFSINVEAQKQKRNVASSMESVCRTKALEAGFFALKKLDKTVNFEDINIEEMGSPLIYAVYVRKEKDRYSMFHVVTNEIGCEKVKSVEPKDYRLYLPDFGT